MDEVKVEMLKAGKEMVAQWMTRLARVCIIEGATPEDSQEDCVAPIYKGKGETSECRNLRGISMLSIPGKVFD